MVVTRHISVKDGDILLLVGTVKGAFLLRSTAARSRWDLGGPYFAGHSVYAMAYDGRSGRRRLWASTSSTHWGAVLRSSDDFGRSWTNPESATIKFPAETGATLRQIWQIRPGRADEPDTLYCGVDPAALFESRDGGETWTLNQGLYGHPHRSRWQPGGGGLCLHTILPDPANRERITVAISIAGVYRSDDGGHSWRTAHQGVRAQFLPNKYPEFGQCVHKIVHHPSRPERLFLQNHFGLYRSDNGGDSWYDIARAVPSDFGFTMAMHPHNADTVYILPLESDEFRCVPEGKLRVYRTRDGGMSWQPLVRGLPQRNALETVLRDAMAVDTLDPAGVYFGTRSGKLYGSSDAGSSWKLIQDGLPAVVCIKVAVVGGARRAREPKAKQVVRLARRTLKGAVLRRKAVTKTKRARSSDRRAVKRR